ncbi:substrate-binding domain-containing protein [bacterium]|nr:substrate-binding domain-containing protein [bacterium]
MQSKVLSLVLSCSLLVSSATLVAQSATADSSIPVYTPTVTNEGLVTSIGSDSMGTLLTSWVSSYQKVQPKIQIQVSSRGSASAPAALLEGTADIGPMTRPLKENESKNFMLKYGFEPTQINTAFAAAYVTVNASSPYTTISFTDLEKMFSAKPQRSTTATDNQFVAVVLNADAPAVQFFKQQVLLQQDWNKKVKFVTSAADFEASLKASPRAVGISDTRGLNLVGMKTLPVSKSASDQAIKADADTIFSLSYPLARSMSIYFVKTPGEKIDASTKDFMSYVLSSQGQEIVVAQGLIPLTADRVATERAKLE